MVNDYWSLHNLLPNLSFSQLKKGSEILTQQNRPHRQYRQKKRNRRTDRQLPLYINHPPHHNHHHHPCHARLFNFLPHCIVAMQKHSMWLKIFQEWETNSKILKIGFHGNLRSFKSGSGCRCFLVLVAIFTVLCNSASFSYFSTDILPT